MQAERTADASAGGHLLVVGATGIIGRAVIEHFAHRPNWTVTAMSRREPDFELGGAEWIRVDLDDRSGTEEALQEAQQGDREPVTHAIFGAVYEQPGGLIDSWASAEMIDRNDAMFRAFLDAATLHSPAMRHLTVMQGGKAYGVPGGNVLNPQLPPYKERRPRVHDGGFYWRQEDYMLEVQGKGAPWTYTIWRPPIVCGFAYNSPLNVMAAIGAHAAVLRELGQPLEYPGASPGQLNEVVDSRLIASAMEWAAENCGEGGAAANQTFNITNGDTAAWEGIYPTIAAHFGMEMGEPAEDWSRDYLAKWAQVTTATLANIQSSLGCSLVRTGTGARARSGVGACRREARPQALHARRVREPELGPVRHAARRAQPQERRLVLAPGRPISARVGALGLWADVDDQAEAGGLRGVRRHGGHDDPLAGRDAGVGGPAQMKVKRHVHLYEPSVALALPWSSCACACAEWRSGGAALPGVRSP